VIDDGALTRHQFQPAFPELDVVGTFATVDAFLSEAPGVDLVVLDLMLSTNAQDGSVLQGPAAIRLLTRRGYRVCLYTDERRPLVLAHCLAAGATGLTRKSDDLPLTNNAFIRAARGEAVVARSIVGLAELLSRRGQLPELTPRQTQVLAGRARGEDWKSIARRLGITTATATDHLEKVVNKTVLYLHAAGLDPDASPADIEHALGLTPGDLMDPAGRHY